MSGPIQFRTVGDVKMQCKQYGPFQDYKLDGVAIHKGVWSQHSVLLGRAQWDIRIALRRGCLPKHFLSVLTSTLTKLLQHSHF